MSLILTLPHIQKSTKLLFLVTTVCHYLQKLHETSRNLLEKYVLDCMYSPFTKILHILTFLPAFSEKFLKAIQGAVSQALDLILPQIKLNWKPSYCEFFLVRIPFSEAVHIEENLLLKSNVSRNYSFVAIRRIAMWKEKASEYQVI